MDRPTEEKDEKRAYTAEDCEETGYGIYLTGKVIVVCQDAFPDGLREPALFLHRRERGQNRIPWSIPCQESA